MTLNKKCLFFAKICLLFFVLTVIWSCASIQRPTGGPRDKTPPKLLKATPLNQTKNFNAKIIQLDFDEYFKLNSTYQEITVSPDMVKPPEYLVKNKSLVIKLKDTLSKNTTYVFNFGKAIADVTEGNILKNFTYVFSTGNHIDSLNVTGTVTDPQTQAKVKDVTVMLIPLKLDSVYYRKKKPQIYTTTDTSGNFKLGNLHAGDYKIYALQEKSPNKIYDNDEELIGFTKNIIHLKKDTGYIQLKLFKQIPEKFRPTERRIDADGKLFFTFNKGIAKPGVRILDPRLDSAKIVDFGQNADTAIIYLKKITFDSIKVSFLDNGKPLDTITLRRSQKETYKRRLAFDFNLTGDKLKPGADLAMKANYPIQSIDPSRITMTEDSVDVNESDIAVLKDPNNDRRFLVKYKWKAGKNYAIAFNEGTFTDIYDDKNIRVEKKFSLDKVDNYGVLILKMALPDTGHYVVQLMNANDVVLRNDVITKSTSITYNNFLVGKYHLRVIYDTNDNGKWDTGNVKKGIQPENIWVYKKELTLRANFDASQDIDVPKESKSP